MYEFVARYVRPFAMVQEKKNMVLRFQAFSTGRLSAIATISQGHALKIHSGVPSVSSDLFVRGLSEEFWIDQETDSQED
jgi:hypothetical protein